MKSIISTSAKHPKKYLISMYATSILFIILIATMASSPQTEATQNLLKTFVFVMVALSPFLLLGQLYRFFMKRQRQIIAYQFAWLLFFSSLYVFMSLITDCILTTLHTDIDHRIMNGLAYGFVLLYLIGHILISNSIRKYFYPQNQIL